MSVYKGIDVSKWQGRIDWPLVKSDGIQFAMIRSTYGWGKDNIDVMFERNYQNAKKLGIPVGAYHYSYARTVAEAISEAEHCYSVIKGKTFEYPIAFDMEDSSVANLGKTRISEIAKAFCERLEAYGYYVCIYANKHWLENYFTEDIFNRYDIWLAQWGNRPTFEKTYGMWQKSARGRVNGISGYVDLDESYKHYPSIMKYNSLNGFKKKEEETKPDKKPVQKPVTRTFSAGDKVVLKNARLFVSSTASTEVKHIEGEYYIYDGKEINGRMRITNSSARVGKKPISENVTGFVKKEELGAI